MRYGYFDDRAKDYVITRPDTPQSWSNYLGTTRYGAIITNNAGGYGFYHSGAQGRFLRLRFNSIRMDQPGRYFYLRDGDSGDSWSVSWQPVGKPLDEFKSTCRHGTAYTIISSEYAGITAEATYVVPLDQNFEYWRLKVTNNSARPRKLSAFTYCEFSNDWNIPRAWAGFKAVRRFRGKTVEIEVKNPAGAGRGVESLVLNGESLNGSLIPVEKLAEYSRVEIIPG